MSEHIDYYTVLQLPPKSSAEKIKVQYRRLAKVYHPDRNPGDEWCEEQLKQINEAYRFLSDESRKIQYDAKWSSSKHNDYSPPPEQNDTSTDEDKSSNASEADNQSTLNSKPSASVGKSSALLHKRILLSSISAIALCFILVLFLYHLPHHKWKSAKSIPVLTASPITVGDKAHTTEHMNKALASSVPAIVPPAQNISAGDIDTALKESPSVPVASSTETSSVPVSLPAKHSYKESIPKPSTRQTIDADESSSSDITGDYTAPSLMDRLDQENRISTANRLKVLGVDIDWKMHSTFEMLDMENRINTANRLKTLGYSVDWHSNTTSDMLDQENRINTANRLKDLGLSVDWKSHSISEMLDWENRINTANRLANKGIKVDWRKYSITELLGMESDAVPR